MDSKQPDKIAAFDTLYTNNRIQMLKILFPIVDKKMRHTLAIYIKYLEFQYTISLSQNTPFTFSLCSEQEETPIDFCELCDELSPFCSDKEQAMLAQFKNIQNVLKQYKELESVMSMMKELFPDGAGTGEDGIFGDLGGLGDLGGFASGMPFSPDMLLNFLSPEQKELFSMFQNKED